LETFEIASLSSHYLIDSRFWGGINNLRDATSTSQKNRYVLVAYSEMRLRRDYIKEKYIDGKYIKGERDINPWGLHPLKKEEIEVLKLTIERPENA
jgi:hypothetical protein